MQVCVCVCVRVRVRVRVRVYVCVWVGTSPLIHLKSFYHPRISPRLRAEFDLISPKWKKIASPWHTKTIMDGSPGAVWGVLASEL